MTRAIHRLIEGRAAENGDATAVAGDRHSVSYRELNASANAVARRLMAAGFKRGTHADVRMPPSVNLAVVLLAILKAGGSYTLTGVCDGPAIQIGQQEFDVDSLCAAAVCGGPNLPVITRETDVACLLERGDGESPVAVPHGTVVAMGAHAAGERLPWAGEAGALDLWIALMAGATAVVSERQAAAA